MAIQVRRGNEADFDASKMLPGEWAVSLDTRYVRMCFAPGLVLRMSTYESFEADMAQIQDILTECRSIQSAVQRIQAEVNSKASLTIEYSNSANQSADRAYSEAERAKNYADNAEAVTGVQIATKDRAGLVKGGDNRIAEDGTLELLREISAETPSTLTYSHNGALKVDKVFGKSEQDGIPTPDAPVEIKSVVVSGVKTHGKNFFKPTLQNTESNGLTCTDNGDGTYKLNGTSNAGGFARFNFGTIHINGTYKFVGCPNDGSFTTFGLNLLENNAFGGARYATYNKEGIVITENKMFGVVIIVEGNVTCNNLIFKPMITTDLEATYDDFETYMGSSYTFSQPIELHGIGDVMDEIDVERGKVVQNMKTFELSSNDSIVLQSVGGYPRFFFHDTTKYVPSKISQTGYCSHFEVNHHPFNSNSVDNSIMNHTAGGLYLRCDKFATVDELKAWLRENNVTITYPIATPIEEDLPLTDQLALNSLATYDGITYLEFDSEIEPTFEGEYGTSKVGGVALESLLVARNNEIRISALETSAVNNI